LQYGRDTEIKNGFVQTRLLAVRLMKEFWSVLIRFISSPVLLHLNEQKWSRPSDQDEAGQRFNSSQIAEVALRHNLAVT
jgi:hypothetical protein